jgi:radical SAM protein with 4Fe4S-binding SPASM domain
MMPTAKALEILDDCKAMGVGAVQFTGGGEPTIHPDFEKVIEYTDSLGLKWSLVSNGVRIGSRDLAPKLAKASWIRISLDAANEETYASMRRCPKGHFEKAKNAIKSIAETKNECVLGVGFVVNPENWREVVDCARLARNLGADNFRISAQFSNEDDKLFEGFHQEAAELCKEAESLSDSKFTVYNRFPDRLMDLHLHRPTHRLCGYQFFTTYIGADLSIYRCCGYAYNDHGLVGSLKEQRFSDLWLSQERFDGQYAFDGRNCERCQFRHINCSLAYALEPQLHEDFV